MREASGETWLETITDVGAAGAVALIAVVAALSALRRWEPALSKDETVAARDELRDLSDPLQAFQRPDRPPSAWEARH